MSEIKTRLFELPITDQGIFSTDGLKLIVRRLKGFVERSWEENGSIVLEVKDSTDAEELLQEIITGDGLALACADCEFDYIGSGTEYGLCRSCKRYRDDSAAILPELRRVQSGIFAYDPDLDGLFLAQDETVRGQYEQLRRDHPELAKLYD